MFNQRQMTGRGLDLFLDNYQWRQAHYFHSMESTETGQITSLPENKGLKGGGERAATKDNPRLTMPAEPQCQGI